MRALPSVLPPGLYEAASRRGPPVQGRPGVPPPGQGAIPRQFTGPQRTSSPLSRPPYSTPPPQVAQTTGSNWLVTPQEKVKYDQFFSSIDTAGTGFLTGDQAVKFFSDSGLSEDALASIWDLADIKSEGQLNRDEFAVAMYLIRQQRSGSAPLPAFLPAALVPPSMRNQPQPPPQPTAPAFDNAANSSHIPKSASEDLFGLDASPPRPAPLQTQMATGSSLTKSPFDSDPFAGSGPTSPTSPQRQVPQPQSQQNTGPSMFKPFMPTSAFGATLASQTTGSSVVSSQGQARGMPPPQQSAGIDDLLGDNDAEESKKLTNETTELANMSTQIGNLRNQMQEVQTKKSTGERDVASTSSQKIELEQRLSQFRAQYEQEVKTVKSLEQQLATSRSDTKRLQQELAMLEGTHQDLQTQHQQTAQALDADQRENAGLKEKIGQLNAEISQLRPQIEKMRSDARQQKGMVAINKKQLATNEGERDRLQTELSDHQKAAETAAEEERVRSAQAASQAASTVVSPAGSTRTNPFFRNNSQQGLEAARSPGGGATTAPSPSAFDALFGPSFASTQRSDTANPPPTSFARDQAPASAVSGQSVSSEGRPTPSATPPLSTSHDSPHMGEQPPPPPPEVRQFTPGILPMRPIASRGASVASSTRAIPAASRIGDTESPNAASLEPASRNVSSPFGAASGLSAFPPSPFGGDGAAQTGAPTSAFEPTTDGAQRPSAATNDSTLQVTQDLPGAFPEDAASPMKGETAPTTREMAPLEPNEESSKANVNDDFDSAFAGFGGPPSAMPAQSAPELSAAAIAREVKPTAREPEFPPIQDLDHDDESDSDDEHGFDDDFAGAQSYPNGAPAISAPVVDTANVQHDAPATRDVIRPSVRSIESTTSELPSITAQTSPPTYEQSMSPTNEVGGQGRSTSNNFPPEFTGLLPAREDPTASPVPNSVPVQATHSPRPSGQGFFPPQTPASATGSEVYQDASSRPLSTWTDAQGPSSQGPSHPKSAFDDAFADFGDLDEAKVGDDRGFDFDESHEGAEFNPTFDSPAASMTTTMHSSQQTPIARAAQPATSNGFHDFESNLRQQQQPSTSTAFDGGQTPQATSHDWDAIFSGLDAPAPNVEPSFGGAATGSGASSSAFDSPTPKATSPVVPSSRAEPPQLARGMSTSSEHDDPILKRLTGMGYSRGKALDALEMYDYDINKVCRE